MKKENQTATKGENKGKRIKRGLAAVWSPSQMLLY
jgi:hypothetical protein